MGDNKAPGVSEKIEREQRSRRLYYNGRFGRDANFDDPLWHHYDNDDVSALHNYRSQFAIGLPNFGIKEFRADRAAGRENATLKNAIRPPTPPAASSYNEMFSWPPPDFKQMPKVDNPNMVSKFEGFTYRGVEEIPKPPPSGAPPASRGLSRHSASAGNLRNALASSQSRQRTASEAQSRRSLRSHLSAASAASLRSKISEAVQKELLKGSILEEPPQELGRSELRSYHEACEGKRQRDRQKQLDMPLHLRTGTNPIDTGCPPNYLTQQMRSLTLPIQLMTDPKWSTDIKAMNNKIGQRMEWEKKMSASLSGSISPELKFMPPQDWITNPPTPYFVPGKAHESRSR